MWHGVLHILSVKDLRLVKFEIKVSIETNQQEAFCAKMQLLSSATSFS